ncbi:GNAT family N-acetyltransferase [Terrimonas alba]|uniref:GNAT family N-acetyltransferase n=1 Tax=Terrimonas alba TaxID=3349636 RepID=UPI0035F3F436
MILFETERLIVRHYTKADADDFFLLNGDEEVVRYIRPAKTREEADQFLIEVLQYAEDFPLYGRWAVNEKETGNFVGSFALIPIEKTDKMQLGYALLKSNWGKGYATELTHAGLAYVFSKTGLEEIYAVTEVANTASQKVLVKAGFAPFDETEEGGKKLSRFIYLKKDFRP